jgi:hypothetical protein
MGRRIGQSPRDSKRGAKEARLFGFVAPGGNILGLFPFNLQDKLLHLVIAILGLYLGFAGT